LNSGKLLLRAHERKEEKIDYSNILLTNQSIGHPVRWIINQVFFYND